MRYSEDVWEKAAAAKGGKFLGKTNKIANNGKRLYLWECSEGHRWEARGDSVKSGTWCPQCIALTPEEISSRISHKGVFLGASTLGATGIGTWRCAKGHVFQRKVSHVLYHNVWCGLCQGSEFDLDEARQKALSRGIVLLDQLNYGSRYKYRWRCGEGHEWNAVVGKGCPYCNGNAKGTVEKLRSHASSKGGRLLSETYTNNRALYKWECQEGHVWENTASNVINQDNWCPKCSNRVSKAEDRLRAAVRDVYPDTVGNIRGLLRTKTFELDIYVPSLSKAVEFDGAYWHRTEKAKERDARKDKQAVDAGIRLLRVNENDFRFSEEQTISAVLAWLKAA